MWPPDEQSSGRLLHCEVYAVSELELTLIMGALVEVWGNNDLPERLYLQPSDF